MFGTHVAGQTFFEYVQQLLSRTDSPEVADVLEVYYLCLLLGYRGRYSVGGAGELQATRDQIGFKIRRIRGSFRGLSPEWTLPSDPPQSQGADPWVKRLTWAAIGCAVFALLLFAVFKLTLSSGVSDLHAIATQVQR
jgi:type VI secretion system protein ImpK